MAGIPQVTKTGPKTFHPVEPILGGQLVEGRGPNGIGVAAAGSVRVLGVALVDAQPAAAFTGEPVTVGGVPVAQLFAPVTLESVAYAGIEVPVKYSAAAVLGDVLVATAAGTVAPAGANPDARTIVGRCTAEAGVAAGAVGLMRTA